MVENDFGIKRKPMTTRNPQANSIIEQVHQTIGNMICSFQIGKIEINEEDPLEWSLSSNDVCYMSNLPYDNSSNASSACIW
jgi:hypothetical protein